MARVALKFKDKSGKTWTTMELAKAADRSDSWGYKQIAKVVKGLTTIEEVLEKAWANPGGRELIFIGESGIKYTPAIVADKAGISRQAAAKRIRAAIANPLKECGLFTCAHGLRSENLTDEQLVVWKQFNAVAFGELSANEVFAERG